MKKLAIFALAITFLFSTGFAASYQDASAKPAKNEQVKSDAKSGDTKTGKKKNACCDKKAGSVDKKKCADKKDCPMGKKNSEKKAAEKKAE